MLTPFIFGWQDMSISFFLNFFLFTILSVLFTLSAINVIFITSNQTQKSHLRDIWNIHNFISSNENFNKQSHHYVLHLQSSFQYQAILVFSVKVICSTYEEIWLNYSFLSKFHLWQKSWGDLDCTLTYCWACTVWVYCWGTQMEKISFSLLLGSLAWNALSCPGSPSLPLAQDLLWDYCLREVFPCSFLPPYLSPKERLSC